MGEEEEEEDREEDEEDDEVEDEDEDETSNTIWVQSDGSWMKKSSVLNHLACSTCRTPQGHHRY